MKPQALVQMTDPESGLVVPPPSPGAGRVVVVGGAVAEAAADGDKPTPSPSEEGGITAGPTAYSN